MQALTVFALMHLGLVGLASGCRSADGAGGFGHGSGGGNTTTDSGAATTIDAGTTTATDPADAGGNGLRR
jgi:hypothetical protein